MSDQELDDLFKEASAKYEVAYEDVAWQKMEALLDAPTSVSTPFWNWKTLSVGILLLIMSSALLLPQWNEPSKKERVTALIPLDSLKGFKVPSAQKIEKVVAENISKQKKDQIQSVISSTENVPADSKAIQTESKQKLNSKKEAKQRRILQQKSESGSNPERNNVLVINERMTNIEKELTDKHTNTALNNNKSKKESEDRHSNDIVKDQRSFATLITPDNKNKNEITSLPLKKSEPNINALSVDNEVLSVVSEVLSVDKESQSLAVKSIGTSNIKREEVNTDEGIINVNPYESVPLSESIISAQSKRASADSTQVTIISVEKKNSVALHGANKKEETKTDSLNKVQRFSVKLGLSPDFSSVGYFKPDKAGFNYGLLGEYIITRHWSVTLGAIWSKKIYSDSKAESAGYGTVNSTQMKGSCRVLDLPLNINYYFTPQNTFSLYTSVGLSSYMMFDEDYTYDYVNGAKSYSYSKKIAKGNTEWFRMMNVSIGIQQQLSSHLRMQLEPFIKAPLSGIGGGDLKLVSSGVFVNLKYTFK